MGCGGRLGADGGRGGRHRRGSLHVVIVVVEHWRESRCALRVPDGVVLGLLVDVEGFVVYREGRGRRGSRGSRGIVDVVDVGNSRGGTTGRRGRDDGVVGAVCLVGLVGLVDCVAGAVGTGGTGGAICAVWAVGAVGVGPSPFRVGVGVVVCSGHRRGGPVTLTDPAVRVEAVALFSKGARDAVAEEASAVLEHTGRGGIVRLVAIVPGVPVTVTGRVEPAEALGRVFNVGLSRRARRRGFGRPFGVVLVAHLGIRLRRGSAGLIAIGGPRLVGADVNIVVAFVHVVRACVGR
ncbi:hypothetical protein NOGI109294_26720 [Nocardiopsis gilva]